MVEGECQQGDRRDQWRWRPIPCGRAGPAVQDLVARRIDTMITGPSVVLPHLRAGTIKVYAVTSKTRLEAVPEIPTTDEARHAGFHVAVWQSLWAPKGTA